MPTLREIAEGGQKWPEGSLGELMNIPRRNGERDAALEASAGPRPISFSDLTAERALGWLPGIGSALGAGLAIPAAVTGPGAIPAAMAGAALGGAGGEALRQLAARALGMPAPATSEEAAVGIAKEWIGQAIGEATGRLLPSPGRTPNPKAEITAYHGSPHTFDAFDMSKVGTGEGGQAYGHGLYFAENPAVAREYKNKLTDWWPEGKKPVPGSIEDRAAAWLAVEIDNQASEPIPAAIKKVQEHRDLTAALGGRERSLSYLDDQLEVLRRWSREGVEFKKGGAMYTVDIPDEAIGKMLDWDKPLSEQPEAVRESLKKFSFSPGPDAADNAYLYAETHGKPKAYQYGSAGGLLQDAKGDLSKALELNKRRAEPVPESVIKEVSEHLRPDPRGSEIYEQLVKQAGGRSGHTQGLASAALRDAGIPGIKYLDQGSRGKGEGTSNFVLFSDKLPKILKRE